MKNEYEAKFINIDEKTVKAKLIILGAKCTSPKTLFTRIIFENDLIKNKKGWVRLRKESGKNTLTYKQVDVDSDATIQDTKEMEVIVDNIENTALFLKTVGLKQKRFQENYREEWTIDNIIYDFDTWPGIPTFLEIEGPDEEAVKKAVNLLGFDYEEAKFGSIDQIYLKNYGRDILKEPVLKF